MERLTERSLDYCTQLCSSDDAICCSYYKGEQEEKCWLANMYDRLAAYEDTGLEPEQIVRARDTLECFDNIGIKRGNEIVKAEQEGRLIVLPCKVGDTVYVFYTGRRNCKWPCNMKKGQIYEVTVSGMRLHDWSDDWSALLFFDTKEMTGDYEFSFDEFGKTIFQTRAEAEKAMEVRG